MTGCVERQRVVEVVVKQAREVGETVFLGRELACIPSRNAKR